jgi:hypothetical protein
MTSRASPSGAALLGFMQVFPLPKEICHGLPLSRAKGGDDHRELLTHSETDRLLLDRLRNATMKPTG